MRTLDVFLGGWLVGHLRQDKHGEPSFIYATAWIQRADARPVSASLPLRAEPFKRNACRPFFAGLLPEETNRHLIAKHFGVSTKNDFAILECIGGECAGAVSLVPPGEAPMSENGEYQSISDDELAQKLNDLPKHPLLVGQEGMRLSLAGAQNKVAIAWVDGKWHLPLHGSPSTHILKPQGDQFPSLVENEFFCMKLAAAAGLPVAAVEIRHIGNRRVLQVERYDRVRKNTGGLKRLHQEDFCQALGIVPELKYQQEGGPNLKQCFELLRSLSCAPGPDILHLFDAVVFNFLIGNGDAHGKNFSLLQREEGIRLAPLYDLVCTRAYPDLAVEAAMKLGGERNPTLITSKHWHKFFAEAGVSPTVAAKRQKALAHKVAQLVSTMDPGSPGWSLVSPTVSGNCAVVG